MLALVIFIVLHSSVRAESQLQRPHVRRMVTQDTVQVTATLTGYRLERDGDIHLILEDSGYTMIAEIPPDSPCRNYFIQRFGKPSNRFHYLSASVTITGLGFWDYGHRQKGAAPNQREIHPVFSLE